MKIGILGGTFNPVHIGHLILAEESLDALRLDRVIFIPAYLPPHKKIAQALVSAADRLNMLRLAISGNPYFEVSDIEIKRGGLSYSIETLKGLYSIYKNAEVFLLVGSDEQVNTWKDSNEILKRANVVIANRPGYKKFKTSATRRISITQVNVSSTMLRRRVHKGLSIRYLVPPEVYSYIMEKKLYI